MSQDGDDTDELDGVSGESTIDLYSERDELGSLFLRHVGVASILGCHSLESNPERSGPSRNMCRSGGMTANNIHEILTIAKRDAKIRSGVVEERQVRGLNQRSSSCAHDPSMDSLHDAVVPKVDASATKKLAGEEVHLVTLERVTTSAPSGHAVSRSETEAKAHSKTIIKARNAG